MFKSQLLCQLSYAPINDLRRLENELSVLLSVAMACTVCTGILHTVGHYAAF